MSILPSVDHRMDANIMKMQLLPKLLLVAVSSQTLSVKVNSLITIARILPKLEKWMIDEQVLPALPKVQSTEPGILMAVLGLLYVHLI
jgi:hypothetical protein